MDDISINVHTYERSNMYSIFGAFAHKKNMYSIFLYVADTIFFNML